MTQCQFCYNEGHTIRSCNSLRINEFEEILNEKKIECNGSIREFNNWLVTQDIIMLQTFTLRKCGGLMEEIYNIQYCCNKIIDTIWGIEYSQTNSLVYDIDWLANALDNMINEDNYALRILSLVSEMDSIRNLYPNYSRVSNIDIIVEAPMYDLLQECSICYEDVNSYDFVKLNCQHKFCKGCIVATVKTRPSIHKCAMCRHEVTQMTTYNVNVKEVIMEYL